jgi:anti-anti-sigma factor
MFHRCVLDGDINASFVDDVWSNIDRLSEAEEDVVLDLSCVDFVDSQGVGAVVSLIKRLSFKGLQLKVTGLHGQPLRLFLDLHLVPVFGVANDRFC